MEFENLRELLPTQEEHDILNRFALSRKMLAQYLLDTFGEEYDDLLNPEAAHRYGRLGWWWSYCDGMMSPEVYYACVEALGWQYINAEHVDPYIDQYCSMYNEMMEKLEITPNAPFLAAELSQAARENALHIDIGDENGGRAYTEEQQQQFYERTGSHINMSYWQPTGPYGKIYFGRGLGSLTWEAGYKNYEKWCISEGLPWRPYQNPEVLSEDIQCSITSLIWSKYISGGAFGDPDKVINAHLNAEDPDQFLIVVQSCAGVNAAAKHEAEGDTRKNFELFLPIIEDILRSGGKSSGGKSSGGWSGRTGGGLIRRTGSSFGSIRVVAGAPRCWPSFSVQRAVSAINEGKIIIGTHRLLPNSGPAGWCAGAVARLTAAACGHPNPNSIHSANAWQFIDNGINYLSSGHFGSNGNIPGMAGTWECVGEVKGPNRRLPPASEYTPQVGDIGCCDSKLGKRDKGFHLEIYLGPDVGRSGWWSDFNQRAPQTYSAPGTIKRIYRRVGSK